MTCSRACVLAVLAALTTHQANAQGSGTQTQGNAPFTLDLAGPAQEVAVTVSPDGVTLPVKVTHNGGPVPVGTAIDVNSTPNAQGNSVGVSVSIAPGTDTDAKHVLTTDANSTTILPINLYIKKFPAPGRYTVQLIIATPAVPQSPGPPAVAAIPAQQTTWRFTLTSAAEGRPATLVADNNAVTLTGASGLCLRSNSWCIVADDYPVVTVTLRDKSGNWPIEGVSARMESGVKAPARGFNTSQLTATFNGIAVTDLFMSPAAGERKIDAHGQATVTLGFKGLEPGDYTIPLRFGAANSGEDDLQKLVITLQVRPRFLAALADAIPAIIVLLLAAGVSFFATRVVSMLRQRAAFLARVRALRPAWLANEPPILPVIWLRSTLRLAESLSNRFWLTGQAEIDKRLAAAEAMLAVLDRMRQVRARIHASIHEPMVQQRAIWKLDEIQNKLGAAPLSDQDIGSFKAQLDQFDAWCDPDRTKWEDAYWRDLLPVIQARYAESKAVTLPAEAQPLATALWTRLEEKVIPKDPSATPPPLSLPEKIQAELTYQRLSILLELCRRGRERLVPQLGTGDEKPIEVVRAVVDEAWWELLKNGAAPVVEGPNSTLDPFEQFETVTFRVEPSKRPFLRGTYLMQKKLKYHWTIRIYGKSGSPSDGSEPPTLHVVSTQPQVAQYSPTAGEMHASVRIFYDGQEGPQVEDGKPVPISPTTDFKIFSKYELTDFYAFGLAAAASIFSGLALYVFKPTFTGSLQDYLSLFTWGASFDQGKNFIQSLGAYSTTTNQPPGQGGGK